MSKTRLRKAEMILCALRAKNSEPGFIAISYEIEVEGDSDRQCAALREKGFKGVIACFPVKDNEPRTGPDTVAERRRLILAGTSYAEPEPGETPAQSASAGEVAP